MNFKFKDCTEEGLWKFVAIHLKENGIDTILVGGAVVSIYSKGLYRSGDLDFVLGSMFVEDLEKSMNEIGFKKIGRHYSNPKCPHLFVEFPGSPPLGIGEDLKITPDEWEVDGQVIKILSPTDCVKDRLASYIYYKDRDGLDQALLVAKEHPVNFESIKSWCKNEKAEFAFEDFISKLKK